MRITITSSGGFAGLEDQDVGSIDTAVLDTRQAQRLEQTVAKLLTTEQQVIGADMMQYKLKISDDQGNVRELVLVDDGNPDNAIQELLKAAS